MPAAVARRGTPCCGRGGVGFKPLTFHRYLQNTVVRHSVNEARRQAGKFRCHPRMFLPLPPFGVVERAARSGATPCSEKSLEEAYGTAAVRPAGRCRDDTLSATHAETDGRLTTLARLEQGPPNYGSAQCARAGVATRLLGKLRSLVRQ